MKTTNLSGEQPDANCLHCALATFFQEFVDAHPEYERGMQAVVDVSQFLGELIGSGLVNSGRRHQLDQALIFAIGETRKTATQLIAKVDKVRTS